MQEDQRTVRSTLNAISGGLSFRTGSIHLMESLDHLNMRVMLLLRWQTIATIGRPFEDHFIDEIAQHMNTLLSADLEEPRRLIDGRREAAHLSELYNESRYVTSPRSDDLRVAAGIEIALN